MFYSSELWRKDRNCSVYQIISQLKFLNVSLMVLFKLQKDLDK